MCFYTFVTLSSRPTADEYLLGPILNGYYVDRPNSPLFVPSDSFVIRYLQGTKAIVDLGWDAYLNAFTFQMGSSALTNYFGPLATVIQGLFFAGIIVGSSVYISKFLTDGAISLSFIYGCFLSGLIFALAVADFNTYRENFGLYTFLGIRFGIYLVHAILLFALLAYLVRTETEKSPKQIFSTVILISVFCGLVSLWYVVYLSIFVSFRFFSFLFSRKNPRFYLIVGSAIVMSTFALNAGLRGSRGRTAAASKPVLEVLLDFSKDVLFNTNSRLYVFELWSTVLGLHILFALLTGIFVHLMSTNLVVWNQTRIKLLVRCLLPLMITMPFVFAFQEYLTYEAWWHRTTPIALSFSTFFVGGIWISARVFDRMQTKKQFGTASTVGLLVVALGIPSFVDGIKSINSFRSNWDRGNILGIGSPIENNADYNVINAFRLTPYIKREWDVQTRMLEKVDVSIKQFDESGLEINDGVQSTFRMDVVTASSYFDSEFNGSLIYRMRVTDLNGEGGLIKILDQSGEFQQQISPGEGQVTTIHGVLAQPGILQVSQVKEGQNAMNLRIVQFELGFSEPVRGRLKLDPNDLVRKK
jgi:hypothetical protein